MGRISLADLGQVVDVSPCASVKASEVDSWRSLKGSSSSLRVQDVDYLLLEISIALESETIRWIKLVLTTFTWRFFPSDTLRCGRLGCEQCISSLVCYSFMAFSGLNFLFVDLVTLGVCGGRDYCVDLGPNS
jgi:hypothetical protein